MNMHQHQAVRLVEATMLDGTRVGLTWVRSFLNRPRYLGGKLRHQFQATTQDGRTLLVTDDQLTPDSRVFRRGENKLPQAGPRASSAV